MRYVAHNYQNYAKNFILAHKVSALFLDCGLGKTITTLTAINELMYDSFEIRKVLIIALLRYSIAVGDEKERLKALKQNSDIYIINRENVDWLVTKSGIDINFNMLIIDELSSFKSHTSKRFKSLLRIRPYFERVVGLTGTPSSNGLMDLWAEFRVLDLGERLGRYITHYRNEYFLPDKRNGAVIFSYKPQPNAEERIYRRLADMTISMKSTEYLKMPELILNELEINLDEEDQIKYKKFKKEMVMTIQEKEIDAINAASLSNKLIQLANGSIYDEDKKFYEVHNKKLDKLEEIIESANGKPVLVAYWFKADKERIEKRFKVKEIKTADDIKQWNMGMINLALIHPASAGHGLNLQSGGSTLVSFIITWYLELYQQTNARLYRQGQKDTVVIHHLITKNTIDEDIMKSLKRKDKTQESLMRAVKARIGG